MASLRARLIRFLARQYFSRISVDSDLHDMRGRFEDVTRRLGVPRRVQVRQAAIADVDCDWLVPAGCDDAPVLLYLHGGAYIMGSSRTHRHLVASIARAARLRAVLPNYRLAPEHPFPAAIEDACAVYRRLLAQGLRPADIAVAGDSAGGGLATAMLLKLRADGDELPAAAVLLSPWLDLSASGATLASRAAVDPLFRPGDLPVVADYYCARDMRREPLVSPVYADVHGLPPLFIQVGDHEILLSDATRLSDSVSAAGGKVTLQIWPEMWHVFQFFAGQMPEASRAVDAIARFLRGIFHRPGD